MKSIITFVLLMCFMGQGFAMDKVKQDIDSVDCSGTGLELESIDLECLHWDEGILEAVFWREGEGYNKEAIDRELDKLRANPANQFPINFMVAAMELYHRKEYEEAMKWYDLGAIRSYFEIPRIRNDGNAAIALSVTLPEMIKIPIQCEAQKNVNVAERAWKEALMLDEQLGYNYNPYMNPNNPKYVELMKLAKKNRDTWFKIRMKHLEEIRTMKLNETLPACAYLKQKAQERIISEIQELNTKEEGPNNSVYSNIGE